MAGRLAADGQSRNIVLAMTDQAVVSGTNFATSIFVGWCGAAELGIYFLAHSLLVFARGIQETIITVPYTIYHNRRPAQDAARFAGSTLAHQLLLAATVSLVLAALFAFHPGGGLGSSALLLAYVAPLYLLREYLRQISFAHEHVAGALVADLLIAAVQLGILLPLALAGRTSVETTWRVIALTYGIAALAWFAAKRVSFTWQRPAIGADWRANWTFGKWALATQLLACSSPYLVPWVLAWTRSPDETGLFGACSTMVGLSHMFLQGISNYLMPRAAHAAAEGPEELAPALKRGALLFLGTLVPVCAAGFAAGPWIVRVVYGPAFSGSGAVVGILALSVLASGMGVAAGSGLCALERPAANFRAGLIAMGVCLATTAALVPGLGPLGAAVATLATTATDAAIRGWTLRRMLRGK